MRAELSKLDQVVADAPADKDLTILTVRVTDSLSSIQKLERLQRRDFREWLHGHPEKLLLECLRLVARLNERTRKNVLTRFIKVPAHHCHQGHPLNELVASRAAVEGDEETAALSDAESWAVRFVVEIRLNEWGEESEGP